MRNAVLLPLVAFICIIHLSSCNREEMDSISDNEIQLDNRDPNFTDFEILPDYGGGRGGDEDLTQSYLFSEDIINTSVKIGKVQYKVTYDPNIKSFPFIHGVKITENIPGGNPPNYFPLNKYSLLSYKAYNDKYTNGRLESFETSVKIFHEIRVVVGTDNFYIPAGEIKYTVTFKRLN